MTIHPPVLVFDGDCGFCTASARWLEHRLRPGVDVTPGASADLDRLGLTGADVASAAWWVQPDGTRHRGHRAIAEALAASSSWVWRLAGRLLRVPPLRWLGRPVYAVVARNRHRLPGSTDACRVSPDDPAAGGGPT